MNLLTFLTVDFTVLAFTLYLNTMLVLAGNTRTDPILFVVASSVVRMITTVILAVTGDLFTIENGFYTEQALSFIPYAVSGFIMVELVLIILVNRNSFSKRALIVILLYLILPIAPIFVELFTSIYALTPIALTLSVILVYVMIQASTIEEGKTRESLLEDLSNTDLLTGLNNRRAYYSCLSDIKADENVGVFFCDMNGLKSANDNFGHAAGDQRIVTFAELMKNKLEGNQIFRISGDEFVVLFRNASENTFTKIYRAFLEDVNLQDCISAVGYSFGKGENIDRLITQAEKSMYEDKIRTDHGRIKAEMQVL